MILKKLFITATVVNQFSMNTNDFNRVFNVGNIWHAVSQLKPREGDGNLCLSTDHISKACDEFLFILCVCLMPLWYMAHCLIAFYNAVLFPYQKEALTSPVVQT